MNESPILHTKPYLKTDAANTQKLHKADVLLRQLKPHPKDLTH